MPIAVKATLVHFATGDTTMGARFANVEGRAAQLMAEPPQFALGRSFDTYGPIGPVLVSPDGFDDPALRTLVDGEERQSDRTSNLISAIPTLVSFLSRITTLTPGDTTPETPGDRLSGARPPSGLGDP